MARPAGRLAYMVERTYTLLLSLAKPECWAGNVYLAERLGCSKRSVSRYIGILKQQKRINSVCQPLRFEDNASFKTMRVISKRTSKWAKPAHRRPVLSQMKVDTSKRLPKLSPLRRGSSEAVTVSSQRAEGAWQPQERQIFNLQDGRATGLPRVSKWPKYVPEPRGQQMKTEIIDGVEREVPRYPEEHAEAELDAAIVKMQANRLAALKAVVEEGRKRDAELAALSPTERLRKQLAAERYAAKVVNYKKDW